MKVRQNVADVRVQLRAVQQSADRSPDYGRLPRPPRPSANATWPESNRSLAGVESRTAPESNSRTSPESKPEVRGTAPDPDRARLYRLIRAMFRPEADGACEITHAKRRLRAGAAADVDTVPGFDSGDVADGTRGGMCRFIISLARGVRFFAHLE
ncbi:MAG TPA: hypothetical protein VF210_20620 [Pseudomonadales bacterium]